VAGSMNRSTYDKVQQECSGGACSEEGMRDVDAGRTQQALANVGFVVGCVGVAAFATLLIVDMARPSPSRRRAASRALGPAAAVGECRTRAARAASRSTPRRTAAPRTGARPARSRMQRQRAVAARASSHPATQAFSIAI